MFSPGGLEAGTLLGLGATLVAVGLGARLAAARGWDPFPVPLLVGLVVSATGPLDALRPDGAITRAGAGIAVVVLLFSAGFDHGSGDRRAAAATLPPGPLLAVDAGLNFVPGAVFGLLAGFGPTGAVLLGGVTWASSWAVAGATLDREGSLGNRETPAVLAVLVTEHAATVAYLPLAAALLAPGDGVARITAVLGSAAAVAAAAWLVLGPARWSRAALFGRLIPGGDPAAPADAAILVVGTAAALAGAATALGVATAAVAYLAGAVLAPAEPAPARRVVALVRRLSAGLAGLGLGLLVPAADLPGAVAGGLLLAALTAGTKLVTGWWAAGRLRVPGEPREPGQSGVGRAGRLRAGFALMPRAELAVVLGILAALSPPGRGPGAALAALAAVQVVVTGVAAGAVRRAAAAPTR
ncbi:MAG TPA: cation:proton antiporter [Acidimicrobiales bacterium]|nr:cation:proton antiporter [Acidimicrobiales bacterium]